MKDVRRHRVNVSRDTEIKTAKGWGVGGDAAESNKVLETKALRGGVRGRKL